MDQVSKIKKALAEIGGQIFSVTFEKKDGTIRDMVCRLNVQKDLKGTRPEANEKRIETLVKNGMVTVWDMVKNGYRVVNLSKIMKIKLNGVVYEF